MGKPRLLLNRHALLQIPQDSTFLPGRGEYVELKLDRRGRVALIYWKEPTHKSGKAV